MCLLFFTAPSPLPSLPSPPPSIFGRSRCHTSSRIPSPTLCCACPDMDSGTGSTLFPLHRCKTLHLVRHAQGIHNVEGEKDHKAYLSPKLFDAHLTPLGWQQVDNLRKHVHGSGLAQKVELVITSPLLRTMQTAVGVFGGEEYVDGLSALPLMVANAGDSNRAAISSLNCPPLIAVETCREHLIENDEDILWQPDIREANKDVASRGLKFLNWLWTRKEKEIAIVTHSGFLYHTLGRLSSDCGPTLKAEISKHFANCELRSMVLVDTSMIGSDMATTNYPGKIPPGIDLPSDVAEKRHPGEETKSV